MGPDLELFGLHKDGREFPVEIALSPLQASGGGLVVTAIRDVSERKRTEESLRMLTSQLLRMQDEERRHIARELHDSAGQILASLSMNLSALDGKLDAELKPRVSESVRLLDELSKQLRTISHLLHPPLLDELGLSSALRFYAVREHDCAVCTVRDRGERKGFSVTPSFLQPGPSQTEGGFLSELRPCGRDCVEPGGR